MPFFLTSKKLPNMNVAARVAALRQWMEEHRVTAYVVPTADPHHDEYIPAHWMTREWITGFTGSAGLAVITPTRAALWTDSRYWLQAEAELAGSPYELMREGESEVPDPYSWLQSLSLPSGALVGCPGEVLSAQMKAEAARAGIELCPVADAFDELWSGRPALPAGPVDIQPLEFAGVSAADKLDRVRRTLRPLLEGRIYVFNDLSDIAWLLNLRGSDIPYNPVFVSYLTYHAVTGVFTLYTHTETLSAAAWQSLDEIGVVCAPYGRLAADLVGQAKAMDFASASCLLYEAETDIYLSSPASSWRALKNEAECNGFREAMLRDGTAMVQFLHWLDEAMTRGEKVTEMSADARLTALRQAQPGFRELSFATIAGYAAHGAIVHYEAGPDTDAVLEPHGLLLLDSGAQYDCGTTDITRTIALGNLTDEEKLVYTLVFKGHLALARMQFPEGTTGLQLDTAARADMWAMGYDFGHGTGHGVGSHLCVHEGPNQIRKNVRPCTLLPYEAGMTVTDEPGIYVAGRFGVRIENTLLCVPGPVTDFGRFLRLESLTLCPYDLRPVRFDLLNGVEREQINAYHRQVREALLPRLEDEGDRRWLEQATAPV